MERSSTSKGFTLTETLVVVALVALVGYGLQYAIQYFYRANAYVLQSTAALNSARLGVTTVASNLREATYGDDGAYLIASAATSSITFYGDIDKDGGVERVKAYLLNGTLYRVVTNAGGNPPTYTGQVSATTTVVAYVRNGTSTPVFRYYNASGSELTGSINVSQIRSVQMTVMADVNPLRAPEVYTLTQTASLRNLSAE